MSPSEPKRSYRRWLLRAVGPAFLLILLLTTDVGQIGAALARANPWLIVFALLFAPPIMTFRAARWRALVNSWHPSFRLTLIESINAYAYAIVVATPTPGRVGELIKISYLKRKGMSFGAGFSATFLDRVFDLAFLLIVGSVAIYVSLAPGIGNTIGLIGSLACAALGIAFLWWATTDSGRAWTINRIRRLAAGERLAKLEKTFNDFADGIRCLTWGRFLLCFALTAVGWALNFVACYACALAIGLELTYLQLSAVAAASMLLTLLPISVLGIGTRDAALIALLAPFGASRPEALALSALFLGLVLWMAIACSYSLLTPQGSLDWRTEEVKSR